MGIFALSVCTSFLLISVRVFRLLPGGGISLSGCLPFITWQLASIERVAWRDPSATRIDTSTTPSVQGLAMTVLLCCRLDVGTVHASQQPPWAPESVDIDVKPTDITFVLHESFYNFLLMIKQHLVRYWWRKGLFADVNFQLEVYIKKPTCHGYLAYRGRQTTCQSNFDRM